MNSQAASADNATARALAEEGEAVRDFIRSNRSDTLLRLFDYLLQQSLQEHRPKETEIAEEVFQESREEESTQGSRVRVGIHRLRKKLDLYYADRTGARIVIPHGEYGLVLQQPEGVEIEENVPSAPARPNRRRRFVIAMVALATLLANLALGGLYFRQQQDMGNHTVRSTLWKGFEKDNPTKIVIGDYFMFMSKNMINGKEEPTQDLSIYEIDGFYERVTMQHGSKHGIMDDDSRHVSIMEGDSHSVSVDILQSVSSLWPIIKKYKPAVVSASELNAEMMTSPNIIYVGALDALTPLIGDPLFKASAFRCADTCYELVEKSSGRHFLSGSPYLLADDIIPRHDYGYIASFPGPSGKRILVISGTGDAGVRQMVNLAMDSKRLQQLGYRIGRNFDSFEALYQVRTMFSQGYQTSLLIAHPIDTAGVWDKTERVNWHAAPPLSN